MADPHVRVVVIAAVVDAAHGVHATSRLLLVQKRDDGTWGCPQGWMRPGESVKETAKRKCSEETGVLVSVERVVAMRSTLVDPSTGELRILVRCRPLAGTPRPGVFELEASYHALDALPELRDGIEDWVRESLEASTPSLD